MVGLSRFELLTPRLSSVCSNQLSYRPLKPWYSKPHFKEPPRALHLGPILSKLDRRAYPTTVESVSDRSLNSASAQRPCRTRMLRRDSRKEVIQPQVLLQLPCYDFTPITDHTLGTCLPCGLAQLLL